MKIRELTLNGYRVFGDQKKLEFSDRVTVIAGVNGKGKTTILDAIALLASRLLPLISPARSGYRHMFPTDVHGQRTSAELTMKVNCAGNPLEFKLHYSLSNKKLKRTSISHGVRSQIKRSYGDPDQAGDQAPLVVYYSTDRAGFRLPRSLPKRLPANQAMAYVRALSNRVVDYREFLARYKVWSGPNGQERCIIAFRHALSTMLDGFEDLVVEEDPLRLRITKHGQLLYLNQLSDGERSLLAIVADLVRRLSLANPTLDDPLIGAGVVLIDEIELHLHPSWQRNVIERLRRTFPNIQFIATTHSPFVIQSLRPGELKYLDLEVLDEYANKSIEDITESVMGVEMPQKSERHRLMIDAATRYYTLLDEIDHINMQDLEEAKTRLDELAMPFSDDPAFVSYLRFQRESRLRGR